jgi:hypothetical protein
MNDIERAIKYMKNRLRYALVATTIDVEYVKLAIQALEKQLNDGWIPVSERLPTREDFLKNDGRFIVTDGQRVYQSLYDTYENKGFVDIHYIGNCKFNETVDNCVVAWQPLPESFKGVEQ